MKNLILTIALLSPLWAIAAPLPLSNNSYQVVCIPEFGAVEIRHMVGGSKYLEKEKVESLKKQNIQVLTEYDTPDEIQCTIHGRTIRVIGEPNIPENAPFPRPTLYLTLWDNDIKIAERIPFYRSRQQGHYHYIWNVQHAEYFISEQHGNSSFSLVALYRIQGAETECVIGCSDYQSNTTYPAQPATPETPAKLFTERSLEWHGWNPPEEDK